ncbi:MAG: dockerin type I domain-containing protein [Candidatus Binatia bacterium]
MHRAAAGPWLIAAAIFALSSSAQAGPSDPDASFGGGDGIVIEDFGGAETGGGVIKLSTGKLLLTGNGNGADDGHSFTRYNTNGTIDETYGTGGTALGHLGTLWSVTRLAGDELLVASDFDDGDSGHFYDAAVMRYTAAGATDPTFGTDGRVVFRLDPNAAVDEHASSVIELASGKLLVGGWVHRGGLNFDIAVVRLDVAGNIDPTFAAGGHFLFDWKGLADKVWNVLELPDKRIIVYGEVMDSGPLTKVFFLRLTENGEIDTTFGGSGTGYRTIQMGMNSNTPGGMVRLPSGKFLFAIGGTTNWTAGRLTADGNLDNDFGAGGIATLIAHHPDPSLLFPSASSSVLAVQGDGRFVIGAWIRTFLDSQPKVEAGLARFDENGTPDTSFHEGSAQRIYTIPTQDPVITSGLLVQSDGAIVLSGNYPNGDDDRWMLRVNGDGPVNVCGDANGDGKINATDALVTLRAAVGVVSCPLSVCDANGDGSVKAADALRVLQYAVGGGVTLNCAS